MSDLLHYLSETYEKAKADENYNSDEKKKKTQSEILLSIASAAELMHTTDNVVYANITLNGHRELWPVRSKGFKRWLGQAFYEQEEKAPSSEALNSTLNVLEGKGQFQCSLRKINTRIAGHDGAIYLDLGNEIWESIKITAQGWEIGNHEEVQFHRPSGMLPLPYPSKNGDIRVLMSLLNVGSDAFMLLVGWLIQAFNPSGPYPILTLNGEQGTAKSSTARILRSLIDPNSSPLRTTPRNERDLSISARNSWILSFDNLSYMKAWLSDALCRLSTGGGFAIRELYTNEDEVLFTAKRPIIINGITDVVILHDLADRAIFISLEPIPDDKRLPEKKLDSRLKKALPGILGGLLNAVSVALSNINTTTLDDLPRMADFALWVQAAEPALPWNSGDFMHVYNKNRENIIRDAVESNIVATTIMTWMDGHSEWTGTANGLLNELDDKVNDKTRNGKAWPKDARQMGRQLRVISSFMRRVGIEIEFLPRTKKAGRQIQIKNR